jgi:hypothetical protein
MVTEFVFKISLIFCSLLIITGILILRGGITIGNETRRVNATYYDLNLKHMFNLNGGPTQYCYFHRVSWNLTPVTNKGCVY